MGKDTKNSLYLKDPSWLGHLAADATLYNRSLYFDWIYQTRTRRLRNRLASPY